MNKLEKQALAVLKERVNNLENKKSAIFEKLMQNNEYKTLHQKLQEMIISYSKQDLTINQSADIRKIENDLQTLETKLLNGEKLPPEFLCNDCKDKGYNGKNICPCLKKIMNEILIEQSGLKLELNSFENSDFSIFEEPDKIKKIYMTLENWCKNFTESPIRNWQFAGNTGTGKTYLMMAMANALLKQDCFIHFTTAFKMLNQISYLPFNENNEEDIISRYLDCDVLFIDDLGAEVQTKQSKQNLYNIFNQRMLENKPTIISTNLDLSELEEVYGERIFSRLMNKANSKAILFTGKDLRLAKQK